MRFSSILLATTIGGAALSLAVCAHAQEYGRLVVFGDSISDNGNLFRATKGAFPPSPPYFQGRVSNGPVWVELLGFGALQPFGAVTGNVGNAFATARTDLSTSPPGLRAQLQAYLGRGGRFGATDLVAVLGGGNNLIQDLPAAAVQPNPGAAIVGSANAALNDVRALVAQLAASGAGTVLVSNLPDIGATPRFQASPGRPLVGAFVSTFNGGLLGQLQTVSAANANANVILMDLARAEAAVKADPARFGFTNVTGQCLNMTTGAACSMPDTFFYWDDLHPSAAGHRLIADLATDYAYYGTLGAPSAAMAESGLGNRVDTLERGLDLAGVATEQPGGSNVALFVEGSEAHGDRRGPVPEVDRESVTLRLAGDHAFAPSTRLGLVGSYTTADVAAGPLTFEATTFAADVYLGWRGGAWFVNAAAGVAEDDYQEVSRATALRAMIHHAGTTSGRSAGAKLQAGIWSEAGGWRVSPRAAVAFLQARSDGYRENGAAARHVVEAREVTATSGEVTLRAEREAGPLALHVEAGYRDWLSYDGDPVTTSLVDNTARPLSVEVDAPDSGVALLDAGLSGPVAGWRLGAGYRGRFGDGYRSHTALATLSRRF